MKPMIKICGVRDAAGLRACLDAGVDAIGFNFVPGSKRWIEPSAARALLEDAGLRGEGTTIAPDARPRIVAVFRDQAAGTISRMAKTLGADAVQLHGTEPPGLCAALGGFDVWKALSGPDADAATLDAYASLVDLLLVDGRVPGSGEAWNYAELRALLDDDGSFDGVPVLVAGGLSADNVARALELSGAAGADVASGVETEGVMDAERIAAFVAAARGETDAT